MYRETCTEVVLSRRGLLSETSRSLESVESQSMWKITIVVLFFVVRGMAVDPPKSTPASVVRDMCTEVLLKGGGQLSECAAYVSGVLDANRLWFAEMVRTKQTEVVKRSYCIPNDLNTRQAAEIFVEWLNSHPKFNNSSAANVIAWALRDKYPCK